MARLSLQLRTQARVWTAVFSSCPAGAELRELPIGSGSQLAVRASVFQNWSFLLACLLYPGMLMSSLVFFYFWKYFLRNNDVGMPCDICVLD